MRLTSVITNWDC